MIKPRLKVINKFILIILSVVLIKIVYMTTIRYSHYSDLADQKAYKQIMVQAPRGEIRDRKGVLLAGNEPQFTVQIVADTFNKAGKNSKDGANKMAYSVINILEKNGETYTDEFPISLVNGSYTFIFDQKISEFKSKNGIPASYNAKKSFYYVVDSMIQSGLLTLSDRNMDPVKLQAKVNKLGYYPPVLVNSWTFTQQKNKEDWLKGYGLKDGVSALVAFRHIRNDYYKIDSSMTDKEARKIMLVRDLLKSKIYTQYNPVTIAKGIKKETVVQIEENSMKLSGVSVAIEQKRVYPFGSLASHVLGYVGKIPSSKAEDLIKEGYSPQDMIGLSGIENSYENKLKGKDGYKEVKVDSVGRVISQMKSVDPTSGKSVTGHIKKKPGSPRTALGWPVTPGVMNYGIRYMYERYNLPIYIFEDGLACNDIISLDGKVHDSNRIDFLTRYLTDLEKAYKAGVPILGYFHWSFTDNFEWHSGYDPRFGLIYVDYETQQRIPKDSAYWYSDLIKKSSN